MSTTDIGLLPTLRDKPAPQYAKSASETNVAIRLDRVIATTASSVPKCSQSENSNVTCPGQHFPLRHVSGRQGPTHKPATSTGSRPVLRRVPHPCRESRARRRDSTLKKRITTVLSASWRGSLLPVTFQVKSRLGFSRCVCFWFGSGHVKCDTAAILPPRPSSSIRKEFKAERVTFFFSRLKSNVAVP